MEPLVRQDHACGIVARVETHAWGILQFSVYEIFDAMAVREQFLGVCSLGNVYVVDKPECAHRSGADPQAAVHPLGTCKTEFALVQHMLQGVDIKVFVTLETHQIVAVPFVIAEEQVLAMQGINVLPILQRFLYGRKRRMIMHLIRNAVAVQPVQGGSYLRAHFFLWVVTVPKGSIESFISLQCAFANGIPMMVIAKTAARAR